MTQFWFVVVVALRPFTKNFRHAKREFFLFTLCYGCFFFYVFSHLQIVKEYNSTMKIFLVVISAVYFSEIGENKICE